MKKQPLTTDLVGDKTLKTDEKIEFFMAVTAHFDFLLLCADTEYGGIAYVSNRISKNDRAYHRRRNGFSCGDHG